MKIEGVIANPKNRQMWDFRSWEVEFGIGSSGMKYAEWNCRGVSEVSGKTELKPRRYGRKIEFYTLSGRDLQRRESDRKQWNLQRGGSDQQQMDMQRCRTDRQQFWTEEICDCATENRYGPKVCAASYRFKGFTWAPMLSNGLHIGVVPLTPQLR